MRLIYDWPLVNSTGSLDLQIREKTETTVKHRNSTHSAAALALFFRKMLLLKRAQVQRNKWNSAGKVSAVLEWWHIFIVTFTVYWHKHWYPKPSCQSSLEHRLVFVTCNKNAANRRTGQDWTAQKWTAFNDMQSKWKPRTRIHFKSNTNDENETWKL